MEPFRVGADRLPVYTMSWNRSKVYYFVAQGYKKVNSSKIDRFRYEMIGKTQPEMGLFAEVVFVYPFLAKSRQFNHICSQNLILQHSIAAFYVEFFF